MTYREKEVASWLGNRMTFKEKYFHQSKTWQERALIMNLFHKMKQAEQTKWRLFDTANYFTCSIGLVSENIKLAERIEEVRDCPTRIEGLIKIGERKKR